jgi:hypothetical protein
MGNELLCKICFEKFNLTNRKPIITMPCCHTICLDCLNLLKKRKHHDCTICRTRIVGDNPNYAVLELLENIKKIVNIINRKIEPPVPFAKMNEISDEIIYTNKRHIFTSKSFEI